MSKMFFNAISGLPIKNGSSISINYGKSNLNRFNPNNEIYVDMNDVDNKYQNRFDNNILLNFLPSNNNYIPPSPTPSTTPTATVGFIPSPTPTTSLTPTTTPTASITPSITVTITPTITSTPTLSVTTTPTSTVTPAYTNTSTPTPTTTPTVSSTITSTPTKTPTPTPSNAILANSANYGNCAGNLSSVGTNGRSSYYGAYDMAGNAWEWNEAIPYGSNRIFRGGNYEYDAAYLASSYRNFNNSSTKSSYIGFRIASYNLLSVYTNVVLVGDPANTADNNGFGSVGYSYYISKYEITNNEYIEFLNAVAQTSDTYGLYTTSMNSSGYGGISRTGFVGSYSYIAKTNMGNKPVNFVSWENCARYCNWLYNGKPIGIQDSTTTENGSYNMSQSMPSRLNNATIFIPTENEWYKAAYYKGGNTNAGYWLYATQSNTAPSCVSLTASGDGIPV